MNLEQKIEELELQIEQLKDELITKSFQKNNEIELLELIKEIYISAKDEYYSDNQTTKKDSMFSLIKYIEEFARNYKIKL